MTAQKKPRTVGFIGAGRMATALATGIVRAGFTTPESIWANDAYPAALESFTAATNAKAAQSNQAVVANAELIILAVKPQHLPDVMADIAPKITKKHLVVSIAAGVPIANMIRILGDETRIVRVMPNTPCLVGAGASAFAAGKATQKQDVETVKELLSTSGIAFQVSESLLDAVTGLSGSGPAYVYQFIEALSDGGVRAGLPRDIATQLAAQTVMGAAKMVLETGEHPGALKDAVTSPGGTTIAGIEALERGGLRGIVMQAVAAATDRSRQLGESQ